jgi:hypothetical protein
MAWTEPFWKPIKLRDGRALATLHDARALIATLPASKQAESQWQNAQALLTRASISPSAMDEALTVVLGALKAEGLI